MTKGHGILREDGKVEVVSKVITGVREPRDEERVDAIDDHRVRRRIRGKRAAQKRDEERRRLEVLRQVIHEEKLAVEKDEGEVLGVTAVKVRELQKEEEKLIEELPGAEERQVLQTRMVGQAEVMKNREEWLPAIKAEMQSLLEEKKAVRIVSQGEAKAMMEDPKIKVEVMPGKMVTTINAPAGKKTCRLVICGNYAEGWKGPGGVALRRWLRCHVDSDGYKICRRERVGWHGLGHQDRFPQRPPAVGDEGGSGHQGGLDEARWRGPTARFAEGYDNARMPSSRVTTRQTAMIWQKSFMRRRTV